MASQGKSVEHEASFYSWEQTFDTVYIRIPLTNSTLKNDIFVNFETQRLTVSVKLSPESDELKLCGTLFSKVKTSECTWTIEDCTCIIYLYKSSPGVVWESLCRGLGALGETSIVNDRKRLLLERFQREHPCFDFSDAEINGRVPDPSTFLNH